MNRRLVAKTVLWFLAVPLGSIGCGGHREPAPAASPPEIFLQVGHSGPVSGLAWSPDGKLLASVSKDSTVKLWDAAEGRVLRTFAGSSFDLADAKWSPDGKTLTSYGSDQALKLWDISSGQLLRSIPTKRHPAAAGAVSPDGKIHAIGGIWDDSVQLWDLSTGAKLRTLPATPGCCCSTLDQVSSLAWSPDGKTLESGNRGTMRLWDAASGQLLAKVSAHSGWIITVAWSPDGKTLASSGGEKSLKLWDGSSGGVLRTIALSDRVFGLAWSPDGKLLAAGSADHTVKLWQASTGELQRSFSGSPGLVKSVAWSPDGKTLSSGSEDDAIRLWDASSGKLLQTLPGRSSLVQVVAWSPDGKILASGHEQTVKLWDGSSGRLLRTLSQSASVTALIWSPDGQTLASRNDETFDLWELSSGRLLQTLKAPPGESVIHVAWSQQGMILTTCRDGPDEEPEAGQPRVEDPNAGLKLWDASSGRLLKTYALRCGPVAWRPDGGSFATFDLLSPTVRLADVSSGEEQSLSGHVHPVRAVAWNPDSETLATGGDDHVVQLWAESTGRRLGTLECHTFGVKFLTWSPDGKTLASFSQGTVEVWDVPSGRSLRTDSDHGFSLAWRPDGKALASGRRDGSVRIWSPFTGETLGVWTALPDNEWFSFKPGELSFLASLHGVDYAAVRFDKQTRAVSPLASYAKVQPDGRTMGLAVPPTEVKPQTSRPFWDIFRK